jgi:hypothetical protein
VQNVDQLKLIVDWLAVEESVMTHVTAFFSYNILIFLGAPCWYPCCWRFIIANFKGTRLDFAIGDPRTSSTRVVPHLIDRRFGFTTICDLRRQNKCRLDSHLSSYYQLTPLGSRGLLRDTTPVVKNIPRDFDGLVQGPRSRYVLYQQNSAVQPLRMQISYSTIYLLPCDISI